MNNLVPLPYSRVAVQHANFALDEAGIHGFLRGKEVWFETDYVVFRRDDACAVARVEKSDASGLFCRILGVEVIALPASTRFVEAPGVDSGNPSALAAEAAALGIDEDQTLVVCGLYEHVCFIHRPRPVVIDVFDVSPPDPPRLLDLARRVLAYRTFVPTLLRPHVQSIPDLARGVAGRSLLYPCAIGQLRRAGAAFYLDERPERRDWVLVGCARSRQIHRHFYGDDCPTIELCPKSLFHPGDRWTLMRCCLVDKQVVVSGLVAIVPWGADVPLVEQALESLIAMANHPPV